MAVDSFHFGRKNVRVCVDSSVNAAFGRQHFEWFCHMPNKAPFLSGVNGFGICSSVLSLYRTLISTGDFHDHRHPKDAVTGIYRDGDAHVDLRSLKAVVIAGYGFAWAAHFFVEKNRQATLRYPIWSLMGDLRTFALACMGRLNHKMRRYRIGD